MSPPLCKRLSHSPDPERWIVSWAAKVGSIKSKIAFSKQGNDWYAWQTFAKMSDQVLTINP